MINTVSSIYHDDKYCTFTIYRTCEICGSIASNVAGHGVEVEMTEQQNEVNDASMLPPTEPAAPSETRSFWRGQWFLNFILVCMIFAFVLCWLFHFNMLS